MATAPTNNKLSKLTSMPLNGEADHVGYLVKSSSKTYAELALVDEDVLLVQIEGATVTEKRIRDLVVSSSEVFHNSVNSVFDEFVAATFIVRSIADGGENSFENVYPAVSGLGTIEKIVVRAITNPYYYEGTIAPIDFARHVSFSGNLHLMPNGFLSDYNNEQGTQVVTLPIVMPSVGIPELVFIAGRDFISHEVRPIDFFKFVQDNSTVGPVTLSVTLYGIKAKYDMLLPKNINSVVTYDFCNNDPTFLPNTLLPDMEIFGLDYEVPPGLFHIDVPDSTLQQGATYGDFTLTITPVGSVIPTAVLTIPAVALTSYSLGTAAIPLLAAHYPSPDTYTFQVEYNGYTAVDLLSNSITEHTLTPVEVIIHGSVANMYSTNIKLNLMAGYIDVSLAATLSNNAVVSNMLQIGSQYGSCLIVINHLVGSIFEFVSQHTVIPVAVSTSVLRYTIPGTPFLVGHAYHVDIQNSVGSDVNYFNYDGDLDLEAIYGVNISNVPSLGISYWVQRNTTFTGKQWQSVVFGNGVFVVTANNSVTCITSSNGAIWAEGGSLPSAGEWLVTFGNGLFVAFKVNTDVSVTSTDGQVWTEVTLPVSSAWGGIAYGNGIFLAVSKLSTVVVTSPDGINWTQRALTIAANWRTLVFGQGLFVAIGYQAPIALTSPDGVTWTTVGMPYDTTWYGATYGNGLFIAVTNSNDKSATSPDGINWTGHTLPLTAYWDGMAYGNGVFVIMIYGSTTVLTSTDGINWTEHTLYDYSTWHSLAFGNNTFVSVGEANEIATMNHFA